MIFYEIYLSNQICRLVLTFAQLASVCPDCKLGGKIGGKSCSVFKPLIVRCSYSDCIRINICISTGCKAIKGRTVSEKLNKYKQSRSDTFALKYITFTHSSLPHTKFWNHSNPQTIVNPPTIFPPKHSL